MSVKIFNNLRISCLNFIVMVALSLRGSYCTIIIYQVIPVNILIGNHVICPRVRNDRESYLLPIVFHEKRCFIVRLLVFTEFLICPCIASHIRLFRLSITLCDWRTITGNLKGLNVTLLHLFNLRLKFNDSASRFRILLVKPVYILDSVFELVFQRYVVTYDVTDSLVFNWVIHLELV